MVKRVVRVRDDGSGDFVLEEPVQTSQGAVHAGRVPVLGAGGKLDASLMPPAQVDAYYPHEQMLPSDTWVILHYLGKYPAVSIADSAGRRIWAEVTYDSVNQVTIRFAWAISGTAYLS